MHLCFRETHVSGAFEAGTQTARLTHRLQIPVDELTDCRTQNLLAVIDWCKISLAKMPVSLIANLQGAAPPLLLGASP